MALATLAAIIASQAVISGAYSMTRQAIQLGFLPRMTVRHTSAREAGQIYMPAVNWVLLAGVIGAVLAAGSSSALAGAYGIAVTLTMLITTLLTYFVVREGWRLPAPLAIGATLFFLAVDALLVAGCAVKFFDGGWFPLALGGLLFVVMSTWQRGRALMLDAIRRDGVELRAFVDGLTADDRPRAPRVAVYAVADPATVPQALLHNLKHNQVLHETQRDPHRALSRCAVDRHDRPRPGRSARPRLLARDAELRLHEHARRAQGAGAVRGAGLADPALRDQLLPQPRDHRAHRRRRHGRAGANACSPR